MDHLTEFMDSLVIEAFPDESDLYKEIRAGILATVRGAARPTLNHLEQHSGLADVATAIPLVTAAITALTALLNLKVARTKTASPTSNHGAEVVATFVAALISKGVPAEVAGQLGTRYAMHLYERQGPSGPAK